MKALRSYLERTRTTQAAFAKRVGVSQPTIANLVNGVHSASSDLLKRIAQETGLSADELLTDDGAPMPAVALREHVG
jgi:transcriptional regulator with XRE-family HTH domain